MNKTPHLDNLISTLQKSDPDSDQLATLRFIREDPQLSREYEELIDEAREKQSG